jgi:hypothetical protein
VRVRRAASMRAWCGASAALGSTSMPAATKGVGTQSAGATTQHTDQRKAGAQHVVQLDGRAAVRTGVVTQPHIRLRQSLSGHRQRAPERGQQRAADQQPSQPARTIHDAVRKRRAVLYCQRDTEAE